MSDLKRMTMSSYWKLADIAADMPDDHDYLSLIDDMNRERVYIPDDIISAANRQLGRRKGLAGAIVVERYHGRVRVTVKPPKASG